MANLYTKYPPRFEDCGFSNFPNLKENKEAVGFLEKYAAKPESGSILLLGKYGVGKTGLAVAVFKEVVARIPQVREIHYKPPVFLSVPDLLDFIRRGYDEPEYEEFFERVKKTSFLVFDDLGAEKKSEWTLEKVFQIINHRYNYLLPTMITSNMTLEELEEAFGQRVTSRLIGMCKVFEIKGKDLRLNKNGE